jgi:hypothetical protein
MNMTRDQLIKDYGEIIDRQTEEIKRLRKVISDVADNLGNGSAVSTEASLEFIEDVPNEVKLVCAALRKEIEKLKTTNY